MKKTTTNLLVAIFLVAASLLFSLQAQGQGAPCDCTGLSGPDLDACLDACGDPNDVPLDDYLPILGAVGGVLGLYYIRRQRRSSNTAS
jgi:hypothetical protein